MSLIVFGGNAKSDAMLAIDSAKKGDFAQADEQIAQAEQALLEAHHSQTKLIQGEARGEKNRSFPSTRSRTRPLNECNHFQRFSERNCRPL